MLYAIRQIKQEGMVSGHDGFPVYVDSPLAVEATSIFLQCDQSCFDEETAALVKQGINPIWFDGVCRFQAHPPGRSDKGFCPGTGGLW